LETRIGFVGVGALTLRREDLGKGLEPDECYYVQTPAPPISEAEFDLNIFPPPDLVIKVGISRSFTPKETIYAALGVGEVWEFDGQRVAVLHLEQGRYVERPDSRAFPKLPMRVFNEYLQVALDGDQHAAVRGLRDWVRNTEPPA